MNYFAPDLEWSVLSLTIKCNNSCRVFVDVYYKAKEIPFSYVFADNFYPELFLDFVREFCESIELPVWYNFFYHMDMFYYIYCF